MFSLNDLMHCRNTISCDTHLDTLKARVWQPRVRCPSLLKKLASCKTLLFEVEGFDVHCKYCSLPVLCSHSGCSSLRCISFGAKIAKEKACLKSKGLKVWKLRILLIQKTTQWKWTSGGNTTKMKGMGPLNVDMLKYIVHIVCVCLTDAGMTWTAAFGG